MTRLAESDPATLPALLHLRDTAECSHGRLQRLQGQPPVPRRKRPLPPPVRAYLAIPDGRPNDEAVRARTRAPVPRTRKLLTGRSTLEYGRQTRARAPLPSRRRT